MKPADTTASRPPFLECYGPSMFERMDPKALKYWLILAALLYLLLPFDFLPDFLGLPGRVDDLLMMVWFAWLYRRHLRQFVAPGAEREPADDASRMGSDAGDGAGRDAPSAAKSAGPLDAHAVLGVPRTASGEAIRTAYRARMMEYHPDKVAHLGEELQKLAHEKSQEIQTAYQKLRR